MSFYSHVHTNWFSPARSASGDSANSDGSSSRRPSTSTKGQVHQQRVSKPRRSSPVAKPKPRSKQSKSGPRHGDVVREFDVLGRHHERNGAPRPPSQLQHRTSVSHRQRVEHRATERESTTSEDEPAKPAAASKRNKEAERRAFWPDAWKRLIDLAKLEWRVYLSAGDAFPKRRHARHEIICDMINQSLRRFDREGYKVEDEYFPEYKYELYTLVCSCLIVASG